MEGASTGGGGGLPPRSPSLPPRAPDEKKSDPDFNFLGALREANENALKSVPPRPPPNNRRESRGVSWDARVDSLEEAKSNNVSPNTSRNYQESNSSQFSDFDYSALTASPAKEKATVEGNYRKPEQPAARKTPSMDDKAAAAIANATLAAANKRDALQKLKSARRVHMQDVIGSTMELEAETYILESVEEHALNQPANQVVQHLLDHIPDQSPLSNLDIPVLQRDTSLVSKLGDPLSVPSSPAPGRKPEAVVAPPKPTTSTETTSGTILPSARPNFSPPKAIPKPTTSTKHSRELTMEETIFGLTTALSAMDDVDERSTHTASGTPGVVPAAVPLPSASADRLAHTVNLLFNRRRTKTEDSGNISRHNGAAVATAQDPALSPTSDRSDRPANRARSGSGNWRFLRENLAMAAESQTGVKTSAPPTVTKGSSLSKLDENAPVMPDLEQQAPTESAGGTPGRDSPGMDSNSSGRKKQEEKRILSNPFFYLPFAPQIKEEWDQLQEFLAPRRSFVYVYCRFVILYMVLPLVAVSFLLYYGFENPPTGKGSDATNPKEASISYWMLFITRNIITISLAKGLQFVVIDFLCLNTGFFMQFFGPVFTLFVASSKGWPFLVGSWALFGFGLLYGDHPFAHHWLYYQNFLDIFNENNPSGTVTSSTSFLTLLAVAISVGGIVSLKRLIVGLYLGQKTFSNFAEPLASVMTRMLLITEVAVLAREIERKAWQNEIADDPFIRKTFVGSSMLYRSSVASPVASEENPQKDSGARISSDDLEKMLQMAEEDDETGTQATGPPKEADIVQDGEENFQRIVETEDGSLSAEDKARIAQLLGQWEDPKVSRYQKSDKVSISAVLQFRRALARMDTQFPFSRAYGLADKRENCVASGQDVFLRLLLRTPESNGVLPFETLATVAMKKHGKLDIEKSKQLIRIFRPERDGTLSLLDFVKGIDKVYKDLRLLRASIENSSKIDRALENIFNFFFYAIFAVIILYILGFDPLAIFLSFSTIILSFTFMIGGASANYVEGLLFILVQRPFGIGDRINISSPQVESNAAGAQNWIVEDVTLFTTTVILGASGERATISNGAVAKARIVNWNRSPRAYLWFNLKFGLGVPYSKIQIFRSAVEKFVHARPREWISLVAFRATRIESDLGFVEYNVFLQHRESWQNIGALLESKAVVQQFCLELQKKMSMRYESPPLPVDLQMHGRLPTGAEIPPSTSSTPPSPARSTPGSDFTISPTASTDQNDVTTSVFAMFEGK